VAGIVVGAVLLLAAIVWVLRRRLHDERAA
jgi:hypothetical protein